VRYNYFEYDLNWVCHIILGLSLFVVSYSPFSVSRKAMALLSSVHDVLPQIFLMTDGSVDDEHDICKTVQTELISRGSKSPRISTFGLGNLKEQPSCTQLC
jgi:hypothetical protein